MDNWLAHGSLKKRPSSDSSHSLSRDKDLDIEAQQSTSSSESEEEPEEQTAVVASDICDDNDKVNEHGTGTKVAKISISNAKQRKKGVVVRRYDSNYLKFGFTSSGDDNNPLPQCVICNEEFSNHSMKPSLLKRHFLNKHKSLENKPLDYFKRKESEIKSSNKVLKSFTTTNIKALEASYCVSLRIARTGKAHTIGETLILPAAKDIVTCMLGKKCAKQLETISLSDNTVSRRISDMASQVKEKVIDSIKKSKFFSFQFDVQTLLTL